MASSSGDARSDTERVAAVAARITDKLVDVAVATASPASPTDGDPVTIACGAVTGGDGAYTFTWSHVDGATVTADATDLDGVDAVDNTLVIASYAAADHAGVWTCTVLDGDGNSATGASVTT